MVGGAAGGAAVASSDVAACRDSSAREGSAASAACGSCAGSAASAAARSARSWARVSGAFRTVNYGIRPIGALIGGTLGTALGVRPTLWIGTLGALVGVVWLIGSPVVRLKTLPEPPP